MHLLSYMMFVNSQSKQSISRYNLDENWMSDNLFSNARIDYRQEICNPSRSKGRDPMEHTAWRSERDQPQFCGVGWAESV